MERIVNMPDSMAHTILIALCNDRPVLKDALDHLEKLEERVQKNALQQSSTNEAGTKRKAPASQLHICVQCLDAYSEADNSSSACEFHDGKLHVDYEGDFWADHDEDCHGKIDTEEMRREFPQGFVWDCCNRTGESKGCTRGWHKSVDAQRGRYFEQ